jgi:hypothetical protein
MIAKKQAVRETGAGSIHESVIADNAMEECRSLVYVGGIELCVSEPLEGPPASAKQTGGVLTRTTARKL